MANWLDGYKPATIDIGKLINEQMSEAKAELIKDFKFMTVDELKELNAKHKKNEIKTTED